MAEENSGKLSGWIKAGLASVFSLVSGAALMYLSPLVNNVIKPSKPVANFAQHSEGLTVTFTNRSSGGTEGWWDFGDGSALEPFVASQDSLQHVYAHPGVYTAKLGLRNFIGEENERSVPVQLDGSIAAVPVIESFQVIPLKADNSAPAVFRLVSKVKNADLAIWSLGDDRPLEFNNDPTNNLDRLVTIKEAGYYTLRLVAVNGKQTAERSEQVWVAMPDQNAPGATLQVTYDAVQVRKAEKVHNVSVKFPAKSQENSFKFEQTRTADPGYQIIKASFAKPNQDSHVKNLKLDISPDKTTVRVTGEMVKATGLLAKALPSSWATQVVVAQEMHTTPVKRNMEPIPVTLKVPGTTVVPVPALPQNWVAQQKNIRLELREANHLVWQGTQLPTNQTVQLQNRPCRLTATELGDQIRLDVVEVKSGFPFQGN